MLLSPSLSPSPLDSPSPVSPPLPVVQLPLPPPPVAASPPLPTPPLAPVSTPSSTPPPVLHLVSPPPAAVSESPVTPPQLPTPPVVVVASPPPAPPPPTPALVILPPPLLPKPSPPPQPSKSLPSKPPSVILPPPAPATTIPSLPPPRLPIVPPPIASISPPLPAASPSISAPKTPRSFQSLPPVPAASHSISSPNTPGFFQAFPPPAPAPPLTLPAAKGGLPTTNPRPHSPIGLIVASLGAGILLFVVFALVCICCIARSTRRRKQKALSTRKQQFPGTKDNFSAASIQHKQENVAPPPLTIAIGYGSNKADTNGSTGIFTYEELVIATNGFSESNLLGQGGFGYVYKGRLQTGQDIAVKKLKAGSRQGEREFQAEVETISRVHHKHLVSLVGSCINGAERLLVYEFVPNKTLEFHLHENGQPVMHWKNRLKIAIGSAKGIAYLHEDCSPTIIHRDIKAANILLDPRFEAKVSDFGLAKIFFDASPSVTHISTRVMGTFGYLAPEYALTGKLTDKSDVYSYGVMLLELITGRRPIIELDSSVNQSLVDWARPLLARALENNDFDTLVDPRLNGAYNNNKMATMVSCAAACIRQSAWLRPRMIQIVRALEDGISLTMLSNSSSNTSSEMFIPNARRCINNGGFSDSTSEYGLNLNPSGSRTESQRTKT